MEYSLGRDDESRLATQRERVLDLLTDGQWHPNHELAKIMLTYRNLNTKLRDMDYVIEARRLRGGTWRIG